MWDNQNLTPELRELRDKLDEIIWLKRQFEDIRTAALLTTSTEWTGESLEHMRAIIDHAADAIKNLDDKIKILNLKIKALEDAL
ncbi:MAG: hypothetical protein IKN27_08860 [Selenomonadaceae bacterium]|nr:hypothetical protein [Selenomonadaceae bacterium]